MADFERPLANNSRTFNTSSPLYIPSPPLGRVWRRRSSEVGIFHSGDFAEYVSGGFVHFTPGDDRRRLILIPQRPGSIESEGKRVGKPRSRFRSAPKLRESQFITADHIHFQPWSDTSWAPMTVLIDTVCCVPPFGASRKTTPPVERDHPHI